MMKCRESLRENRRKDDEEERQRMYQRLALFFIMKIKELKYFFYSFYDIIYFRTYIRKKHLIQIDKATEDC